MTTFQDKSSGLKFSFSENWTALIQFDEHPDVIKFAKGLSCVDFVGVLSENKLVLIETKNFKNRPVEERQSIFEKLGSRNESPVVDEVAKNMKDFVVFVSHISQKEDFGKGKIWKEYRASLLEKEVVCVLWLELDNVLTNNVQKTRMYAACGILTDLFQKELIWLAPAKNVFVASQSNQHTNPFGENLRVSFLRNAK